MYSAGVRPLKATGTRWIDPKIAAVGSVIEKIGLYTQQFPRSRNITRKVYEIN